MMWTQEILEKYIDERVAAMVPDILAFYRTYYKENTIIHDGRLYWTARNTVDVHGDSMDKIKAMDLSEAIPEMRAFAQQVTLAFLELDSKRLASGQRTKANWSDFMADLLQELARAVESGDIEMVAKIAVVCASSFLQRIVVEDSLERRGPEVHAWAVQEIRRDQVEPATARRTEVKKEKWNEIRADAKAIQERNPDWDIRAVANQLYANYRAEGRGRGYGKSTIERALDLRSA